MSIYNNISNNANDISIIYGFILIRIVILYISTYISSNIMNQIYSERVLINGSDPQPLYYQILIFLGIDLMLNAFLYAFIFGLSKSGTGVENGDFIINSYTFQYTISLFIISVLSYLVSTIMYNKKYFLYKDDGLRAIRALQLIMFRSGTFLTLLPIFIFILCN